MYADSFVHFAPQNHFFALFFISPIFFEILFFTSTTELQLPPCYIFQQKSHGFGGSGGVSSAFFFRCGTHILNFFLVKISSPVATKNSALVISVCTLILALLRCFIVYKNIEKKGSKTKQQGRTQQRYYISKYAPKMKVSQMTLCDTCMYVYAGPL